MRKTRATSALSDQPEIPAKPDDYFELRNKDHSLDLCRDLLYRNIGKHTKTLIETWRTGRMISVEDLRKIVAACEKDKILPFLFLMDLLDFFHLHSLN
ncbi:hypothetical protein RDWZM_009901 [Blomia tropicalis]|uniref:Uncharacterized protein n=1 Tax=Blomia tropicalis TaxID=40697 RepID=A0A9Q0LYC7_BLOTA|nr:hypothetical protein RDWZM_009901 [Blomia tropicalis]